jgi:hypothetical protein
MGGFRSLEDAELHERRECQPNSSSSRKRQRPGSPSNAEAGETGIEAPFKTRRIPLLARDEKHILDTADAVACQNLELFEATQEHMGERDASGSTEVIPGQVGIRCMHCVRTPLSAVDNRMIFPSSVFAIGSGVRAVTERHLLRCPLVPRHAQETIERSLAERKRGRDEDEERSRKALLVYCTTLCQEAGVIERYPQDSGLIFREAPGQQQQASLENPVSFAEGSTGPNVSPIGDLSFAEDPSTRRMQHSDRSQVALAPAPASSGYGHSSGYASYPPQYSDAPYGYALGTSLQGYSGNSSYSGPTPQYQQQSQDGYPFYQTPDGSWECRYCSGVHPQHRDQGSIWRSVNPPANEFIDQHLGYCRFYNQSIQTSMQPYSGMMFAASPMPLNYPKSPHQQSYGAPLSPHHDPPSHGWPTSPTQASSYPSPHGLPVAAPPQVYVSPHGTQYPFSQGHDTAGMAATMMSPVPMSMAAPEDHVARQAINYLTSSAQKKTPPRKARHSRGEEELVLDEDKILLTDYFFHVMKQLRVCRFTEADRKTRGGKRDNIAIGYGGLQCVHCAEAPNSRKFFWSNVDRLANSFAEIPGHILKCRMCPPPTKQALQELKLRHADQMARLPRGSQKVFFRRMWRRLHEKDPQPGGAVLRQEQDAAQSSRPARAATTSGGYASTGTSPHQALSPSTSGEESAFFVERSVEQAARQLVISSTRAARSPPSPSSRVLLAIPEDKEWLSDMDCFIRRNVEVFPASEEDLELNEQDRKYPIQQGQVGIRCIHCAIANGRRGVHGNAVNYPYAIASIYESVREIQRLHLETCPHLPPEHKSKFEELKGSSSLTSVLRKYYVLAAKALGLYDTQDGVRSGAESVPLVSSAAFAFSPESESKVSNEMLGEQKSDKKLPPEATTSASTPGPEEDRPSSAESSQSAKI